MGSEDKWRQENLAAGGVLRSWCPCLRTGLLASLMVPSMFRQSMQNRLPPKCLTLWGLIEVAAIQCWHAGVWEGIMHDAPLRACRLGNYASLMLGGRACEGRVMQLLTANLLEMHRELLVCLRWSPLAMLLSLRFGITQEMSRTTFQGNLHARLLCPLAA